MTSPKINTELVIFIGYQAEAQQPMKESILAIRTGWRWKYQADSRKGLHMEKFNEESRKTAIANLHMLRQYATGEATPRKADDPVVRYQKVLAYLMTGSCVVDDDLKLLVGAIDQALNEPQAAAKAA
jgi:hypothetical protein